MLSSNDLGMSIQLLEACLGPTKPEAAYLHALYNLYDFTLKLSCLYFENPGVTPLSLKPLQINEGVEGSRLDTMKS